MTNIQSMLILGGCRSGKSGFAKQTADSMAESKKIYLATSVPADPEMEERVKRHQDDRGPDWATVEEPVLIHDAIVNASADASVILVDCLTLWTSNLLFKGMDEAAIMAAVDLLAKALDQAACPVILVSNEVGYGIVPENSIARQFRDMAGLVNQRVAKVVDLVFVTMAGIPVQIKPGSPQPAAGKGPGLSSGETQ